MSAGAPGGSGPSGVRIHPTALVESTQIGEGTRIWAFVHVLPGAVIGRSCNLCDHVYVEGGARIGDHVTIKNHVAVWDGVRIEDEVFVGPSVTFTNVKNPRVGFKKRREEFLPTVIETGATLGAGSVILCGVRVGCYAMVAAGAVVIRDVAPFQMVAGNPAAPKGWACVCGARLPERLVCGCGRRYRATGPSSLEPEP